MTERDSKGSRESFDAFKELVMRYPDSKYARGRARATHALNLVNFAGPVRGACRALFT